MVNSPLQCEKQAFFSVQFREKVHQNRQKGGPERVTNEERKLIFELRMEGLGYKAIAARLNKTRDSIRSYCQRHNIGGDGSLASKNMAANKGVMCENCGKPITQPPKGRTRRFCSDTCRREWWSKHPESKQPKSDAMYELTCAQCGRQYESYGNKTRKFCSHGCYIQSRFYREESNVNAI